MVKSTEFFCINTSKSDPRVISFESFSFKPNFNLISEAQYSAKVSSNSSTISLAIFIERFWLEFIKGKIEEAKQAIFHLAMLD